MKEVWESFVKAVWPSQPTQVVRRDALETAPDVEHQPKKPMYFDSLPDIAFENVTQHLSARLNSQDWPRYLNEKDLASIYHVIGEFGKFVLLRFHSIPFVSLLGFLFRFLANKTIRFILKAVISL